MAAEQLLAEHGLGTRRIILRLAGIYGPGRIPKLAAILAGEAIESSAHGFLNLIHVEDAVEDGMDGGMRSFEGIVNETEIRNIAAYLRSIGTPKEPKFYDWWVPVPTK